MVHETGNNKKAALKAVQSVLPGHLVVSSSGGGQLRWEVDNGKEKANNQKSVAMKLLFVIHFVRARTCLLAIVLALTDDAVKGQTNLRTSSFILLQCVWFA